MQDSNLIFLLSLPRSGSTMTQKVLGTHSNIFTCSEPWLLLNPLSVINNQGIWAKYNNRLAINASQEFIKNIPGVGKEFYYESLRKCYCSIYNSYLNKENKSYFLDKTPRYYNILPELIDIFPNAKIILLYRNPLAVLVSIIETWIKPKHSHLSSYRIDLMEGVDILSKYTECENNIIRVQYEKFLVNPNESFRNLCQFLEIPFERNMIDYGGSNENKWNYGDQDTVYSQKAPDNKYQNKWIEALSDPDVWSIVNQFIEYIGKNKFESLGYDFEDNKKLLNENKPTGVASKLDLFKQLYGLQEWGGVESIPSNLYSSNNSEYCSYNDDVKEQKNYITSLEGEKEYLSKKLTKVSNEFYVLRNDYVNIIESYKIYRMINIFASFLRRFITAVKSFRE